MNAEAVKSVWVKRDWKGAKWWLWSTHLAGVNMLHCQWHCNPLCHHCNGWHLNCPFIQVSLRGWCLMTIILMGFPVQQQWEIDGCEKVSCYMYDAIVFVVHCLKLRRLACWIRGQCLGTMSDCTQGADSAPWCTSRNPCYNVWHTCCFGLLLQLWARS